jgi:hypothetical protein
MKLETKTLLYLIALAIVDTVLPIPITASLLIYVLLAKPPSFGELVLSIYKPR